MFRDSLIGFQAWQCYKSIDNKGLTISLCPRCRDAVECEKDARKHNFLIHYRFCIQHQNKYINHYEN